MFRGPVRAKSASPPARQPASVPSGRLLLMRVCGCLGASVRTRIGLRMHTRIHILVADLIILALRPGEFGHPDSVRA